MKYLRRLPQLQVLRLSENPIANDNNYKHLTIAHLKALQYLDYELITTEDVWGACLYAVAGPLNYHVAERAS